jgi:hypothetical protein
VGAIEFDRVKELCDEHGIVGQIHPWVLSLGTTSRDGSKTKSDQIIFLGSFL